MYHQQQPQQQQPQQQEPQQQQLQQQQQQQHRQLPQQRPQQQPQQQPPQQLQQHRQLPQQQLQPQQQQLQPQEQLQPQQQQQQQQDRRHSPQHQPVQQPQQNALGTGNNRHAAYQAPESLPLPAIPPGDCPPGLQVLIEIDQLFIKQKKEVMEIVTGVDMPNQYAVLNTVGQVLYMVSEKSSTILRNCCGPTRPFELCITDANGEEVVHVSRPYRCMCLHQGLSCMDCCKDLVTVEAPPGHVVGQVRQLHNRCEATYEIMDAGGNKVLSIDGPNYCHCYCPGDDIPFKVKTDTGEEVGRVSRQWSNAMQEYFTDADTFGITFPAELHINVKTTIIGACFLIDFMFFEKSGRIF